jgi:hypothetical protein
MPENLLPNRDLRSFAKSLDWNRKETKLDATLTIIPNKLLLGTWVGPISELQVQGGRSQAKKDSKWDLVTYTLIIKASL